MSKPLNSKSHQESFDDFDIQSLAGRGMAEAVGSLLQQVAIIEFRDPQATWTIKASNGRISREQFIEELPGLWVQYDARDKTTTLLDGDTRENVVKIYETGLLDPDPHPWKKGFFWDEILYHWMRTAISPLAKALEEGHLLLEGQQEPVKTVDQARKAVPYPPLDKHRWRLIREKSRIEVFNAEGWSQKIFRHTVLTSPRRHEQPPGPLPASPTILEPLPRDFGRSVGDQLNAMRLIEENWGDTIQISGSRDIATWLKENHQNLNFSTQEFEQMAEFIRGRKLPRGRPRRSAPK